MPRRAFSVCLGLALGAAALSTGPMGARAVSPLPTWVQWQKVGSIFDVAGRAPDGSLIVGAGNVGLKRVTPEGEVSTFDTAYTNNTGTELYLAVSPGLHLSAQGCDFPPGEVEALQLGPSPAVVRINTQGQTSVLAQIPGVSGGGATELSGITFDTVGGFGNQLLVSGFDGSQTVIDAVDCNGRVTSIAAMGPMVEGGLSVAPPGFGAFGGDLIAADELDGNIYAIAPRGAVALVVGSGLPKGQDVGVESTGFVPAGFSAGGEAYVADRYNAPGGGGPVTGTDHVLRLDSSVLIAQGVQDGDMLVAAEGDGSTIGVRCGAAGCITYAVANTAGGHAEGHITFTLTGHCQTPATMPAGSGGGQQSTFYFAEGFTGPGFTECLVMFSPGTSGPARIDFFTTGGGTSSVYVWLFAGQVETLDVNGAVGWYQDVSAKVTLPGPGVVERVMNFQFGQWHGSSDVAGAPTPTAEWDFAEGSTLSAFDEFLTLENPNSTSTPVQLAYFLDNGGHPIKTLTIPAQSRTTIEVFSGSGADSTNCVPRGVGASCGIGRGIGGVGVSVTAGASIIAERPMYVDGHDFGSGPINDGDVAFGANGPGNSWDFAEGTTLGGFNEYLTLADPSSADANVTMTFQDQSGNQTVRNVVVPASQRRTVQVFDPVQGVGPGVPGVSVQVTSNVGIVSERPEYVYHDFGSGPVAGADVVVGARVAAKLFDFAGATTRTGENDYLTVLNPGASAANLTITYYLTGSPSVKTMPVAAGSRLTIQVFDPTQGVGTGVGLLGVTVSSDQPVLVEKPTYSSSPSTYGATDTLGN